MAPPPSRENLPSCSVREGKRSSLQHGTRLWTKEVVSAHPILPTVPPRSEAASPYQRVTSSPTFRNGSSRERSSLLLQNVTYTSSSPLMHADSPSSHFQLYLEQNKKETQAQHSINANGSRFRHSGMGSLLGSSSGLPRRIRASGVDSCTIHSSRSHSDASSSTRETGVVGMPLFLSPAHAPLSNSPSSPFDGLHESANSGSHPSHGEGMAVPAEQEQEQKRELALPVVFLHSRPRDSRPKRMTSLTTANPAALEVAQEEVNLIPTSPTAFLALEELSSQLFDEDEPPHEEEDIEEAYREGENDRRRPLLPLSGQRSRSERSHLSDASGGEEGSQRSHLSLAAVPAFSSSSSTYPSLTAPRVPLSSNIDFSASSSTAPHLAPIAPLPASGETAVSNPPFLLPVTTENRRGREDAPPPPPNRKEKPKKKKEEVRARKGGDHRGPPISSFSSSGSRHPVPCPSAAPVPPPDAHPLPVIPPLRTEAVQDQPEDTTATTTAAVAAVAAPGTLVDALEASPLTSVNLLPANATPGIPLDHLASPLLLKVVQRQLFQQRLGARNTFNVFQNQFPISPSWRGRGNGGDATAHSLARPRRDERSGFAFPHPRKRILPVETRSFAASTTSQPSLTPEQILGVEPERRRWSGGVGGEVRQMEQAESLSHSPSPTPSPGGGGHNATAHAYYRRQHISRKARRKPKGDGEEETPPSPERVLSVERPWLSPPSLAVRSRAGRGMGRVEEGGGGGEEGEEGNNSTSSSGAGAAPELALRAPHPPERERREGHGLARGERRREPVASPIRQFELEPDSVDTTATHPNASSKGERRGSDRDRPSPKTPIDRFYCNPTNQKEYIERLHRELPLARGVDAHGNVMEQLTASSSSANLDQSMGSRDFSVASVDLYGVPQAYQKRMGGISSCFGSFRKSKSESVYIGSPHPHLQKKQYPTPIVVHSATQIITPFARGGGGNGSSLGGLDLQQSSSPIPSGSFSPSPSASFVVTSGPYSSPGVPQRLRSAGQMVSSSSLSSPEISSDHFNRNGSANNSANHPSDMSSTHPNHHQHRKNNKNNNTNTNTPNANSSSSGGGNNSSGIKTKTKAKSGMTSQGSFLSDAKMNNFSYRSITGNANNTLTNSSSYGDRSLFHRIHSGGGGGGGIKPSMRVGVSFDKSPVKQSLAAASTVLSAGRSVRIASIPSVPFEGEGGVGAHVIPDAIPLPFPESLPCVASRHASPKKTSSGGSPGVSSTMASSSSKRRSPPNSPNRRVLMVHPG